jgi:methyltransferase-like protein
VDFHVRPLPLVNVLSERPCASPLVRVQAETSILVTNLRHEAVQLDDLNRRLLPLLDGTRDRAAILASLTTLVEDGTLTLSQEGQRVIDRVKIQSLLEEVLRFRLPDLVRLAILVA